MESAFLDQTEAVKFTADLLGGKAYNLAQLTLHDFPVPQWYVVTTDAVALFMREAGIEEGIQQQVATLSVESSQQEIEAVSKLIQQQILEKPLPQSLMATIEAKIDADLLSNQFVAVRSSVVGEDAEGASFAGQMDSYLFQKGKDEIYESIVKVIASAFNQRALAYRLQKKIDVTNIQAAIIIQEMINGDVSGVMFTAHPVTGSRQQALISGTYGCGEGVVSGLCSADEYSVHINDNTIESVINVKDTALVFDGEENRGTREITVEEAKQNVPCLTDSQIQHLKDMGVSIAESYLSPQDIEWTIANNRIYILQARPITQLPAPQQSHDNLIVWDNSNIQESYCGVTTPLTFTFANRAYATVYEQSYKIFGLTAREIQADRQVIDNLLGIINGRVYYNINNWYRGLLRLPSFGTNKADMERMMGLEDPVDMIQAPNLSFTEKLKKIPQMFRSLGMLLIAFSKMDRLVAQFRTMFDSEYLKIERKRLHTLTYSELIALSRQLDENLLKRWTTPILNDFYVMMSNGKVSRWLEKTGLENAAALQNNLMSGEEGIESTEPTKMLLRMCQKIRGREALKQLISDNENDTLLPLVKAHDSDFYADCMDYIERYGDRVMGELKLESITLRQDPSFLFAVLKNYLSKPDLTIETLHENELKLRAEAEDQVFSAIADKQGTRALNRFKKDLQKLRCAVRNRENMRLARTRMFGLYRDIYLEIGNQLAFYGLLESPRDIFYVTIEELYAYNDGRSIQKNFKPMVAARKEEFAAYETQELPHHFWTWGPVYHHNPYEYPFADKQNAIDENADTLKGTGCYPGVVEKPIRLIFSPQDELNLDGQILCTVRTDPGWAPLFPTAGGIIVERGSTLSHSAVVARELGIPAIVGVPGLTKILQDKELVKMDGASGIIERLNAPVPASSSDTASPEND
ncbi:MAG: phosphoenolpyruvate synthase [Gammaproteobacteria bacterium]|nr:MAG: phosphoenolpyruvate synthase [Gammaproteobacteria bacterium]